MTEVADRIERLRWATSRLQQGMSQSRVLNLVATASCAASMQQQGVQRNPSAAVDADAHGPGQARLIRRHA
jgi:hypothetical protein